MSMIEITVDDDVAGEQEYTIAFHQIALSTAQEGAQFEVDFIWNLAGYAVRGGEFDTVATHALDCYYDEMLEGARK